MLHKKDWHQMKKRAGSPRGCNSASWAEFRSAHDKLDPIEKAGYDKRAEYTPRLQVLMPLTSGRPEPAAQTPNLPPLQGLVATEALPVAAVATSPSTPGIWSVLPAASSDSTSTVVVSGGPAASSGNTSTALVCALPAARRVDVMLVHAALLEHCSVLCRRCLGVKGWA